jgi:predicted transposase/invertase (TIGR01784 family)
VLQLPQPVVSVEYLNPFGMKDFETDKLICVDVKATDDLGRVFVIEVQIVVHSSFAKRAVFYACEAYTDQLREGQGYGDLKATYSICLMMRNLWNDNQLHHQFQLVERESGMVLEDSIEIHTVELVKYNGRTNEVRHASVLEQWAYWIKNSSEHTVEELRELLPGLEFLQATGELNAIREITEEKQMYDAREKASLDIQSNLIDARQEGQAIGLEKGQAIGLEKGQAIGLEKGQAIGLEKGQAIGRIRLLQELLGVPVASDKSLPATPLEQLTSIMEELQAKLRQRGV